MTDLLSVSKKSIQIKLHAAMDSFVPLGEGATSTLPSKDSITEAALKLFNA